MGAPCRSSLVTRSTRAPSLKGQGEGGERANRAFPNRPGSVENHRVNPFLRFWFPVLLYITLIFTVSSIPNLRIPNFPGLSDKLVHACEYGVLGFLMVRALRGTTMATSVPASLVAILFGL